MKIHMVWATVWSAMFVYMCLPSSVNTAPITIDFNQCLDSVYPPLFPTNGPVEILKCCPPKPTKPAINGAPPPSTNYLRVRKASQCVDKEYEAKLAKAYELMRALPDDDPRSITQQWYLHCSYCGGAFTNTNSSGIPEGINIHFSWLFFPWHRWFLFFHERILQSLLGDPTFSLNYWNWDNPYTVGPDGSSKDRSCLKEGNFFPRVYADPSSPTFDYNRSQAALGKSGYATPNFNYNPGVTPANQSLANGTVEQLIGSNMNLMYLSMVSLGSNPYLFMGLANRAGQPAGQPFQGEGGGILEGTAHAGTHFWMSTYSPTELYDMGDLAKSARDPVFFAHHSNIDRLWEVWKTIGPIVGGDHVDHSDPDFLNASFLFYDENKVLRRVKVEDGLDTTKLGYVYQGANDAAWLYFNQTRCSNASNAALLAEAESLPEPTPKKGYYSLQAGTPFVIIIDRPANPAGLEEFLTIDGIKLDHTRNAGFDVYVDLINPASYSAPYTCAEYTGRFTNMRGPLGHHSRPLVWKVSITRALVNIQAPPAPSQIVITLVPFSQVGDKETIQFKSISIEP